MRPQERHARQDEQSNGRTTGEPWPEGVFAQRFSTGLNPDNELQTYSNRYIADFVATGV